LHELLAVGSLAAIKGRQPLINAGVKLLEMDGTEAVVLLKQSQSFPNDYPGGVVAACPNLSLYQFFEFEG